jgi:hypothetical protein
MSILVVFLFERYAKQQDHEDDDQAIGLAGAVTNALFSLPPTNEVGRTFLATHGPLIERALRDIESEPRICHVVSVFTHMLCNVAGNSGTFSAEMLQSAVRLRQLGILLPIEQMQMPITPERLVQEVRDFEQWVVQRSTPSVSPGAFLLSYTFCYQGFPKTLFANPIGVIAALQADGFVALQTYVSSFLQDYVRTTPAARPHIPKDFSSLFSVEVRRIDASLSVVLISYPAPPKHPVELQPDKPILAPYFTGIAFNPSSSAKFRCFVLGQRPGGGTTLRSVSGENSHGNCGAGCSPDLEEFLSLIVLVEREGVEAAWKRYPQG